MKDGPSLSNPPPLLSSRAISSIVARSPPGDFSSLQPTLIFKRVEQRELRGLGSGVSCRDEMSKVVPYSEENKL